MSVLDMKLKTENSVKPAASGFVFLVKTCYVMKKLRATVCWTDLQTIQVLFFFCGVLLTTSDTFTTLSGQHTRQRNFEWNATETCSDVQNSTRNTIVGLLVFFCKHKNIKKHSMAVAMKYRISKTNNQLISIVIVIILSMAGVRRNTFNTELKLLNTVQPKKVQTWTAEPFQTLLRVQRDPPRVQCLFSMDTVITARCSIITRNSKCNGETFPPWDLKSDVKML